MKFGIFSFRYQTEITNADAGVSLLNADALLCQWKTSKIIECEMQYLESTYTFTTHVPAEAISIG
jgi:hypothetical protein